MFSKFNYWSLTIIFLIISSDLVGNDDSTMVVTPNASQEAVELFKYIKNISGKSTLTGQHCAPLVGSTRLPVIWRSTKKYPALFGQDFGFSAPGTWDGINFRQRIVDEAILRSYEGFIITLMWHAVPPTMDEPVTFKESIQGELTDEEWDDLVTSGTKINEKWKSQVDVIAWFLKQIQAANVPVLWRPYHEMNGDWFWWGQKKGENGYKKLYHMLYDRLVNFHGINNLIWVYNCNELRFGVDSYEEYYPGNEYVDILATDVYQNEFGTDDYEKLLVLAGDKPIALGEVGKLPSVDDLQDQPRWTWFMGWGDPPNWREDYESFLELYNSENTLTLDELPWAKVSKPVTHSPILK